MFDFGREILKKVTGKENDKALVTQVDSGIASGMKVDVKRYDDQKHVSLDEKNPKYIEVKKVLEEKLKIHNGDPIILSLITALSLYDNGGIGIQHMNEDGLTFLTAEEVQNVVDPVHDLAIGTGVLIRLDEKKAISSVAEIDTFSMVDLSQALTGIEPVDLPALATRTDINFSLTNKNTPALQSDSTPIVEIEEVKGDAEHVKVRIGIYEFTFKATQEGTLKVHDKLVIHVKDPDISFLQDPKNIDGIYKVGSTIVKRDGTDPKPTQPQLL